jgi:hypothetical protein
MAKHVLINTRILAGAADLTSMSNQVNIEATAEKKNATSFGQDGWTSILGGLKSGSIKAQGQWEAGDPTKVDNATFAGLGLNAPWSIYPSANETYAASAGYGSLVYFVDGMRANYKLFDKVGEVAPWQADVESNWPVVRGKGIHPPGIARTATGTGTGVQHIAVPAGAYLYGALHVLSVAGTGSPTLAVKVQSDADNTFASPADQITFTTATVAGGEIKRTAGPVTDTWYRVSYTITGTGPSFLFALSIGVA